MPLLPGQTAPIGLIAKGKSQAKSGNRTSGGKVTKNTGLGKSSGSAKDEELKQVDLRREQVMTLRNAVSWLLIDSPICEPTPTILKPYQN